MVGHSASLLVAAKKSCDVRPCRPHLYKKRKGGPATTLISYADRRRREQQIPRCARNDKVYRSGIFWPGAEKCRAPSLGVLGLRPSTPLPQDDIWGWEDFTATWDDIWGWEDSTATWDDIWGWEDSTATWDDSRGWEDFTATWDDIWGWEDSTATWDDSRGGRGRLSSIGG
jgi:hypothetical protein